MLRVALAAAATLLTATAVQAASYHFTFVGSTYSVTDGAFTTTGAANGDGTFDITSASGTLSASDASLPQGAFTLTPGNGASLTTGDGQETYSNLYTPGAASFAQNGLEVAGAGFELNLYNGVDAGYGACTGDCASVPGGIFHDPGDLGALTITAVPEPATWALMLAGTGGLGVALRRRRAGAALAA